MITSKKGNKNYYILEAGSTHMGKKQYVKELVKKAADINADAVKFQLFPNIDAYTSAGNVFMTDDLFMEAYALGKEYGVDISASVFSKERLDFLCKLNPRFIKFSHSKSDLCSMINGALELGHEVIVSRDQMNVHEYWDFTKYPYEKVRNNVNVLFCIPKYPVYGVLDHESIMETGMYDGFSDHTLGIKQTMEFASHEKCKIIEKHVTLEYSDIVCPDRRFAINFKQAKQLINP